MNEMNAVGWFDVYVDDMDRAVGFYENVLGAKLEAMDDPTSESRMMSFPGNMHAYGAAGALWKQSMQSPAQVEHSSIFWSKIALRSKRVQRAQAVSSFVQNFR